MQLYEGNALWPGFRVAFFQKGFPYHVSILEPGFYWRVRRDYGGAGEGVSAESDNPKATMLPLVGGSAWSINALEELLLSDKYHSAERIVLHAPSPSQRDAFKNFKCEGSCDVIIPSDTMTRVLRWAEDSVGLYPDNFEVESQRYGQLPPLGGPYSGGVTAQLAEPDMAKTVISQVRLCDQVHHPNLGNRSCFDKCK